MNVKGTREHHLHPARLLVLLQLGLKRKVRQPVAHALAPSTALAAAAFPSAQFTLRHARHNLHSSLVQPMLLRLLTVRLRPGRGTAGCGVQHNAPEGRRRDARPL